MRTPRPLIRTAATAITTAAAALILALPAGPAHAAPASAPPAVQAQASKGKGLLDGLLGSHLGAKKKKEGGLLGDILIPGVL